MNGEARAINGWIERLKQVGFLIRDVGVPTLMLCVFIAWASGWMPSELTGIHATLQKHDARVTEVIASRLAADQRLATILEQMAQQIARENHWQQIRTCAEIKEPDLRHKCLSQ